MRQNLPQGRNGAVAAPARDGNIAILQEFRQAHAVGTAAALELFITRHPDHPLARRARALLEHITQNVDGES